MVTPLDIFIGVSWLVNFALDIGAAFFCYRLTKVTGGFRAWWLIIVFTVLFATSSFFSVSYGVLITGELTSSTQNLLGSAYFSVILNFFMSILLFTSMFELNRTFRRVQKEN